MATDPATDRDATVRLPIVGEATGLTRSEPVSGGQGDRDEPARPGGRPPPAPILAVHGVGDFGHGDVISEMAERPSFARRDDYHRLTVMARGHRYTLLMDSHADPEQARLMEVNWSDVRRPMPNAIGLLRNFVIVLMSLLRIGVNGAYRSRVLCRRLWCGPPCLWTVEGLMVGSAAVPVLSALLWQLEPGQRMAAGLALFVASGYLAFLLREMSLPMAAGALGFGLVSLWAGWLTCYEATGHHTLAYLAGAAYAWSTLAGGFAIAVAAVEIALQARRTAGQSEDRWLHRFARMGCLWLPAILLIIVQPLAVSALLLPMEEQSQQRWGQAFSLYMPFSPEAGQYAGTVVAWGLAATVLLGAGQFKVVQRFGRSVAVYGGLGVGLALLVLARLVEDELRGCALCQRCLRPDLLSIAGIAMAMAATVTWVLFSRAHPTIDVRGRAWYPAGTFARFWASVLLYAAPGALLLVLGFLVWQTTRYHPTIDTAPDAAEVFVESTKYVLLLVPLATRPFAAFLDALGDVFFFVVRQRNLSTRQDTQPRLSTALRYLHRLMEGGHSGDHMIVLAHSQGTVVAAAILSRMVRVLRRTPVRLTLVTLGSPLTTLYRNFLGAEIGMEFGELCRAKPDRFRWINLARPGDYIGGAIEWPGVDNRELLTPGDHIGYWSDEELLSWLKALSRRLG